MKAWKEALVIAKLTHTEANERANEAYTNLPDATDDQLVFETEHTFNE